jgi:hypothetical protein
MKGLSFQVQNPVREGSPNRMDIACFVGLVGLREQTVRDDIEQWLYRQSWLNSSEGYKATYHRDDAADLLDVPVPIESWERFTQLFEWDLRQYSDEIRGAGYLATSVRSFFAQGGRKCYVVRVASPLPISASKAARNTLLKKLIPGFPRSITSTPEDRDSWRGVGHLLGLPDVTMLCLPDLPDLLRAQPGVLDTSVEPAPTPDEQFVICSDPVAAAAEDSPVTRLPAPRCDLSAFKRWAKAIHHVAEFVARYRPDVQLIAAIPLADETEKGIHNLLQLMHRRTWLGGTLDSNTRGIASAFVQLCYPWLRSAASQLLPERLEPPDGSLAGMLARNAITRGAYRSLTGIRQTDVRDIHPRLSQAEMFAAFDKANANASPGAPLIERVSLFGNTADGVGILSDVTSSNNSAHRPANLNRIISMVRRTAQKTGEEYLFESNGERLWAALTQRLNDVLRVLYDLGALRGKQPEDAFFVRCDRSTMSQQDLDTGRVVAQVQFEPAASIESIEVVLSMQQNGSVSRESIDREQAVA